MGVFPVETVIALSFMQGTADVKEYCMQCSGKPIKTTSKIENVEGVKNFVDVLTESAVQQCVAKYDPCILKLRISKLELKVFRHRWALPAVAGVGLVASRAQSSCTSLSALGGCLVEAVSPRSPVGAPGRCCRGL